MPLKTALILICCLLLSACAANPPPPEPAPHEYAHTLTCKESVVAWADCYAQYGAQCDNAGRVPPAKL